MYERVAPDEFKFYVAMDRPLVRFLQGGGLVVWNRRRNRATVYPAKLYNPAASIEDRRSRAAKVCRMLKAAGFTWLHSGTFTGVMGPKETEAK